MRPCRLRPEVGDVRQVQAIDIHTFNAAVDIIGKDPEKWRPKTRETADHSLPYCTAVALVDGNVSEASVRGESFHRSGTAGTGGQDQAPPRRGSERSLPARHSQPADGEADGRARVVREVEFPRGHALNPMTDAEVERSSARWSSRATARSGPTVCWRPAGSWRS